MTFKSNSLKTVIYLSNLTILRFLITFLQFKTHITDVFTFNKKQFLICIRLRHEACDSTCTPEALETCKKGTPCLIKKLQDVRQIARLKQRSLYFTVYKTERSYKKTMCIYLLFNWFSGENCIIKSSDRRRSI